MDLRLPAQALSFCRQHLTDDSDLVQLGPDGLTHDGQNLISTQCERFRVLEQTFGTLLAGAPEKAWVPIRRTRRDGFRRCRTSRMMVWVIGPQQTAAALGMKRARVQHCALPRALSYIPIVGDRALPRVLHRRSSPHVVQTCGLTPFRPQMLPRPDAPRSITGKLARFRPTSHSIQRVRRPGARRRRITS
jgi:hypothetical protein